MLLFYYNLLQNLAIGREFPNIPRDDVLVLGPRVEGLEPLAGQGGLGVPQQALLCLATSAHGLKSMKLSHGYFIIRTWSSKLTFLVRSMGLHYSILLYFRYQDDRQMALKLCFVRLFDLLNLLNLNKTASNIYLTMLYYLKKKWEIYYSLIWV